MGAAVDIVLLRLLRLLARGVELFLGSVAGIRMTSLDELQRRVDVELIALRLEVRAIGPADLGALVPGDAEPAKAVQNRLQRLRTIPLGVGVVDAQHELAAEASR